MKSVSRKLAALSLSCALAVSLAGCDVSVTGVSLNLPDSMEKGATFTATPEYTFDGATPESADLAKKLDALDMSYTSSDSAVLVVDEDGNMVAVSAGTAEVALSSKDGKITASKTIEVVVTPTNITTTGTLTLTAGEAATLETAVAPADATHVVIRYTSSDNSVATVSDTGEVKAVGAGEADITAAVENTELSAVCKITVLPKIESVDLNYTELSLKVSGTAQLTYTVQPEDAVAETTTYTSSDESVATVDEEGTVTAVADGTTTITVDVDGVTAECEVTVSTKAASAAGSNSGSSAASGSGQTEASAPADSSGFEYGAIPFSNANDGNWWFIDQADSPYWAVLNNINAMRAAGGLTALSASSSLDSIAYSRCDYQLKNNTLSHEGAQTPEILAQSQQSAAEVCSGWQNSPSHYAVIMNPNFTQIGICCFYTIDGKTIWCCTFG
mgnify:FL=1